MKSIGEITCRNKQIYPGKYPLVEWYNTLLDKPIEALSLLDITRMLQQHIFESIGFPLALDILKSDPTAGEYYEGDLLETVARFLSKKYEKYCPCVYTEIGERYDLTKPIKDIFGMRELCANGEVQTEWYGKMIRKTINLVDATDVENMFRFSLLPSLALDCAFELLHKDPFVESKGGTALGKTLLRFCDQKRKQYVSALEDVEKSLRKKLEEQSGELEDCEEFKRLAGKYNDALHKLGLCI